MHFGMALGSCGAPDMTYARTRGEETAKPPLRGGNVRDLFRKVRDKPLSYPLPGILGASPKPGPVSDKVESVLTDPKVQPVQFFSYYRKI